MLIKGHKIEKSYNAWYLKGILQSLKVTRLYEYYMMSKDLSKEDAIPKIVLMYFAFDSSLDSTHNAFLYAYMHKNRQQYPELYESYREQIERFTVFQILKGRNNKTSTAQNQNKSESGESGRPEKPDDEKSDKTLANKESMG